MNETQRDDIIELMREVESLKRERDDLRIARDYHAGQRKILEEELNRAKLRIAQLTKVEGLFERR